MSKRSDVDYIKGNLHDLLRYFQAILELTPGKSPYKWAVRCAYNHVLNAIAECNKAIDHANEENK